MRHAPSSFRMLLFLNVFGLLLAQAVAQLSFARAEAPEFADKRVLLLHSYHPRFIHTREMNRAIERYLEPTGVDLYIEYLDTKRHFSPDQMDRLAQALALRYETIPMDAIIVTDDNAVDFIFNRRDALFPGVPVIFCGANDFDLDRIEGQSGITGVNEALSLEDTLGTALELHPKAREVVVISDVTATGDHNLTLLSTLVPRYRNRVAFRHLVGLPRAEMVSELSKVSPGAVVLYLSYFRTSAGENFSIPESMRFISGNSAAPVYALWDFTMGHGVVGGKMVSSQAQGKTAAQLTLQVLSGVSPDLLPVVMKSPNRYIFDHRQLRKFGISPQELPENSQLRFVRVPPLRRYLPWVVTALGIIGLETLLIGTLLLQRARLRRTEAALRENRARYRALFEEAPDAIYLHDLDGTFLDGNQEAERLLGFSREELVGRSFLEIGLLPEDQVETARSLLERNRNGETTGPDGLVLRHRDGTRMQMEIKTHVLDETSGPVVLGIFRDITEREQAQAALQKANQELQRLATAIDQAAEVILITDPRGRIEYANPAFERVTGYPVAEVTGHGPGFLMAGRKDAGDAAGWTEIRAAISRGAPWSGRITGRHRDGRILQAEAVISPVRDLTGQVINFVAVMRDITAEIELEAQLRQAQKMEAVGQLAGGVAHDFNNLLQVISGYAEMAAADLGSDHPIGSMLTEVLNATGRAQHLVRQLLVFSRREASHPRALNLNEIIEGMIRMISRVLGEHIELEFRPGPNLPSIQADPHLLEQVLMNLCVNARDAMTDGGHLRLTTEVVDLSDTEIRSDPWLRPGRFVRLSVSDTGCGIRREVRDRIFEPFFSTKEVGKGTGLGLATVYGIVKQHEGFIQVASEGGCGTAFHIYLPAAPAADAMVSVGPSAAASPPAGRGETILLAEDDEMVRKLATRILERAGYQVRTARDGEEALRRFQELADQIDLVILDVVMPRRSGRAVSDEIHAARPNLPILFASGYSYNILEAGGVIPGQYEVLPKPFRSETLLERVHQRFHGPTASPAPASEPSQRSPEPGPAA